MKKSFLVGIIGLFFVCGLTGCSTQLNSNVTSFHYLAPNCLFVGSIYVKPEGTLPPSLEFSVYAQNIYSGLSKYGFTQSTSESTADYIAFLGYATDDGKLKCQSIPTTNNIGTCNRPLFVTHYDTISYYVYTRTVSIRIMERIFQKAIWESRNTSCSTEEFTKVIPTMINAMVTEFPGESGKSHIVRSSIQ